MQEKTKQETLEEVAERLYKKGCNISQKTVLIYRRIFIDGAKCQQERSYSEKQMDDAYDKGFKDASEKRYSEEEVFKLIEKAIEDKWADLRYWFEQFKKK